MSIQAIALSQIAAPATRITSTASKDPFPMQNTLAEQNPTAHIAGQNGGAPSHFSKVKPGLQLAWDATSLRALMQCEEKYDIQIRQGWRGSSVHTDFGGLFASALEVGWKARGKGASVAEAQLASVKWAMLNSGRYEQDHELSSTAYWRPWGGEYATHWKCKGERPYKNAKGNKAKCPAAFVSNWHEMPRPEHCGICGSETFEVTRWMPYDSAKNRHTLIRTVSLYWDEQTDDPNGLQIAHLPDGRPAVELSFCIPSGYKASTGEDFLLCGHLDTIKRLGHENFISDNKTTGKYLSADYFAGYSPDVQMDLYDLCGSLMFPGLNLSGVLVEAAQVTASTSEFANHPLYRTEAHRKEFHTELGHWFAIAEDLASRPPVHNRGTCWLCGFRGVCSKSPSMRKGYLQSNFHQQKWNPLTPR